MPALTVDRLTFSYGAGAPVLSDVSMTASEGQSILIVGDNGSGKSTMGRLLAGLLKPTAGTVRIGGSEPAKLPSERRCHLVSYMSQVSHLSILTASIADELASFSPRAEPLALEESYRAWAMASSLPVATDTNPRDLTMPDIWRLVLGLYAFVLRPQVLVIDEIMCPRYNADFAQAVIDLRSKEGGTTVVFYQRPVPLSFDVIATLGDNGILEIDS